MNEPWLSEDRLRSLINSRSLLRLVRAAIALSIATAVLHGTVIASAFSRKAAEFSMGTVTVDGAVTINGQSAISGQTLFSSSNIVTDANSGSLISLSSSARLRLGPATDLTVDPSRAVVSGSLKEGQVFALIPAGVSLDFKTVDASIETAANEPTVLSIQSGECSGTTLFVQTGAVDIHAAGNMRTVKAGETFSTAPNSSAPQNPQNSSSHRKRLGLLIGIGATIGIILGVVLGKSDKNQSPFGGCVIVPSGDGGPGQCS